MVTLDRFNKINNGTLYLSRSVVTLIGTWHQWCWTALLILKGDGSRPTLVLPDHSSCVVGYGLYWAYWPVQSLLDLAFFSVNWTKLHFLRFELCRRNLIELNSLYISIVKETEPIFGLQMECMFTLQPTKGL